jgi:hypothetical protein
VKESRSGSTARSLWKKVVGIRLRLGRNTGRLSFHQWVVDKSEPPESGESKKQTDKRHQ